MTASLTINDRPTPASVPGHKAPGCTAAPTPWSEGPGAATANKPWAANETRAGAMTGAGGSEGSSMTDAQRAALSALIHPPVPRRVSRWERRERASDVVWALVLVLLLALSTDSLFEGLRFVRSADASQTLAAAVQHLDGRAARGQSSGVVRRTM